MKKRLSVAAQAALAVGGAAIIVVAVIASSGALHRAGGTRPSPHHTPRATPSAVASATASPNAAASASAVPSPGSLHLGATVHGTAEMVFRAVLGGGCTGQTSTDVSLVIDPVPGRFDPATGVLTLAGHAKMENHSRYNGSCPSIGKSVSGSPRGTTEVVIRLLPGAGSAGSMELEARSPQLEAMVAQVRGGCARLAAAMAGHGPTPTCSQIHGAMLWSATPRAGNPDGMKFESCTIGNPVVSNALLGSSGATPLATTAPPKCKLKANTTVRYTGSALRGPCWFGVPGVVTWTCSATGSVDLTVKTNTRKIEPDPLLAPTTLAFGNVAVGANATQGVTVSNQPDATEPLQIASVSVTPGGQGFSVSGCNGASLSAGQSCTLAVVLSPTIAGATQASVLVNDNAINSPQTVTLSGTGAPDIGVSPMVVNFQHLPPTPMTPPIRITITNTTPASGAVLLPLRIGSVTMHPGGAFVPHTGYCANAQLAPQRSCTFQVRLRRSAGGHGQYYIDIASNAAQSPSEIVVHVNPTPSPRPRRH